MHSKSDDLGYLKDQKRKLFWGFASWTPTRALPWPHWGVRWGLRAARPPKPSRSKVLTVMYLFFSGLTLRVWLHF